jgi:hypothetical protein
MVTGRIKLALHVASTGEVKNAYKILAGKLEGNRLQGRTTRRWENNNKMDLI